MTGSQKLGKAVRLLAALVFLVAAGDPDETSQPRSWLFENTLSLIVFGVVAVGAVAWAVLVIRRRIEQRRAEEEQAAMLLEAQVSSLLAPRQGPSSAQTATTREATSPPEAAVAGRPVEPSSPAPVGAASVTSGGEIAGAGEAVEAILAKLRSGGLLGGIEGAVYLSDGRSEGKIVRLSDGKVAVVLPCLESAEFLARQLRRFDLCIVALGNEQTCVISPFGSYIADRVSLMR